MGFKSIKDINAPDAFCNGISILDSTVDQNRQRVSTLEGYLPRATVLERQSNLAICTGALVSCIEFSDDQPQPRAQRVKFQYANSKTKEAFHATVNKEVVVISGAIGSPQLLMLRWVLSLASERQI